ncbi:MAG: serine/threonine protein kinase [Planctomycetales bacterium]|nr:serine/threonine protein kinase [Planctomycetales bacterium]
MGTSLTQFVRHLTDSGLMSVEDIAAARSRQPDDTQEFARELVRQKKLTRFQAEQIYLGKGQSLVLGNYVILDRLGEGGMGMVFKAEHKRMKRLVALKVVTTSKLDSPDAVRRFRREVEAAAKLSHPNIVAAHDADEAKGAHFLVMEFVDGDNLSHLVKTHGPLPVEWAVDCIVQAARGLAHAHTQGVIHRDIKPSNLMLDKQGNVKILDMGLARLNESKSGGHTDALTDSDSIFGTVDYMSPEQALNTKRADRPADIYSLGVTLFFLVTGNAPFTGGTAMEKLVAHREQPIPSLADAVLQSSHLAPLDDGQSPLSPGTQFPASIADDRSASVSRSETATGLLAELNAVFQKMVAKNPNERQASMTDVIADLQRCVGTPTTTAHANALRERLALSEQTAYGEFHAPLITKSDSSAGPANKGSAWTTDEAELPPTAVVPSNLSDTDPTSRMPVGLTTTDSESNTLLEAPPPINWTKFLIGSLAVLILVAIGLKLIDGGPTGENESKKRISTVPASATQGDHKLAQQAVEKPSDLAPGDRQVDLIPLMGTIVFGDGRLGDVHVDGDMMTLDATGRSPQLWLNFPDVAGEHVTIRTQFRVASTSKEGYVKLVFMSSPEVYGLFGNDRKHRFKIAPAEDDTLSVEAPASIDTGREFTDLAFVVSGDKLQLLVDGKQVLEAPRLHGERAYIAIAVGAWRCEFKQPRVIIHSQPLPEGKEVRPQSPAHP